MYKTIVIGYYPKASTMAKKVEEKYNTFYLIDRLDT